MGERVLVLGAGFGGLELSTILSEERGDAANVTLIDKGDAFTFGYSKLDVLFGRETLEAVRLPYRDVAKPGVRLLRETITAIDPDARRVTTDAGVHEADVLVVALGADYEYAATPGLSEDNEFYSVAGAARLAPAVRSFSEGHALIGVCGAPFKCPPAPSECALLLHDELTRRGVRERCRITFSIPLGSPVPPSPETSAALLEAFAERDIAFVPGRRVTAIDPARGVATFEDGGELAYDLFLGVPKHRAPDVVLASGMTEDGYVPVDAGTLATRYPGVYAVGDVSTAGVPKAGVFAEGAARVAARGILAQLRGDAPPAPYDGVGTCYIRSETDRRVRRPLARAARREGALRLRPARALVRPLSAQLRPGA